MSQNYKHKNMEEWRAQRVSENNRLYELYGKSFLEVRPMTDEEAERIDKVLKEARALRASMLKRRKGKLVPYSTHIISQARDEYP